MSNGHCQASLREVLLYLSDGNLVLVLLLVLPELGALKVGLQRTCINAMYESSQYICMYLDHQPDLHPEPGLCNEHPTNGSLASVQGKLLILKKWTRLVFIVFICDSIGFYIPSVT